MARISVPSGSPAGGTVSDTTMAGALGPQTAAAIAARAELKAAFVPFVTLALNPDMLISGTITRDANSAATSAPVTWPDGTAGTYTADTVSTTFPGAVDAYHITYGSPVVHTYTQPAVTRDATTGAVTQRPALVVS